MKWKLKTLIVIMFLIVGTMMANGEEWTRPLGEFFGGFLIGGSTINSSGGYFNNLFGVNTTFQNTTVIKFNVTDEICIDGRCFDSVDNISQWNISSDGASIYPRLDGVNVGIGTPSPANQLEIQGNNAGGGVTMSNSQTDVNLGTSLGLLKFATRDAGGDGFSAFIETIASETHGAFARGGQLEFSTTNNQDELPSPKLIISADGDIIVDVDTLYVNATSDRVGIGTPNPDEPLHVSLNALEKFIITDADDNNNIRFELALNVVGQPTIKMFDITETETFRLSGTPSQNSFFNNAGKVGIGTPTPKNQLEWTENASGANLTLTDTLYTDTIKTNQQGNISLASPIRLSSGITWYQTDSFTTLLGSLKEMDDIPGSIAMCFGDQDCTSTTFTLTGSKGTGTILSANDGLDIQFSDDGIPFFGADLNMIIKGDSGNVGIGTNNPNATLHVDGYGIIKDNLTIGNKDNGIFMKDAFNPLMTIGGGLGMHIVNTIPVDSTLEVHSEADDDPFGLSIHRHTNSTILGANLMFLRSRDNHSDPTIIVDGDIIGRMAGFPYDGTDYSLGAEISFIADGEQGNDDSPTAISFSTTPDGSNVWVERMRIKPDGTINIGNNLGNLTINGSGRLLLEGDARVERELIFKATSSVKGASAPSNELRDVGASGNLKDPVIEFSRITQQDIYGSFHPADDMDESVDISFHLMWIPAEGWTTGAYNWSLEYLLFNESAQYGNSTSTIGTPTIIWELITPDNANDFIETEFSDTISINKQEILTAHFYRDVGDGDTADDGGQVRFFEVEYTVNSLGH